MSIVVGDTVKVLTGSSTGPFTREYNGLVGTVTHVRKSGLWPITVTFPSKEGEGSLRQFWDFDESELITPQGAQS